MKIENDFKKALAALPEREKDKLIVRLLKKDMKLLHRLHFELIDTRSVEERRAELSDEIQGAFEAYKNSRFHSKDFIYILRGMSGLITEHVFITKDKFGEPLLTLKLLVSALGFLNEKAPSTRYYDDFKIYYYILDKVFNSMKWIQKLDPDYLFDFKSLFVELQQLVSDNLYLCDLFIKHGMDINWFSGPHIPEDVEEMHKNSRFLR